MGSFRFLHAADIHLDSPLRGLSGQEGSTAERIRTAPREAFVQLVSTAISEGADFLIVAGDLYDGDWRDYRTGLFFAAQMGRLNEAGIPVFVLHGNHDAESQITRTLGLPENVRVFGSGRPETFRLESLDVALHGQSFGQRAVRDNLVPGYPVPLDRHFNIGVLHTGFGGMEGHEDYAPCALPDLLAKGYDYWALGHVHRHQVLHERPPVVFPGNLQGRHIREVGVKGAVRVDVEHGAVAELVQLPMDTVRWSRVIVDLDDVETIGETLDRIGDALEASVAAEADGRLLACRIECHGRTALHAALEGAEDRLLAEARAAALGLGVDVAWVERVVLSTSARADGGGGGEDHELLRELDALWSEALADADLAERLRRDPGDFVQRLPHALRAGIEPGSLLDVALRQDPGDLIQAVIPHLSRYLTVAGE